MSALPPKADIRYRDRRFRFVPKADILRCGKECRYSITSSATEQRNWECDAERAFAVLRLMTRSYLVGACTDMITRGRSMSEVRFGACLCGAIRYQARGQPQRVTVCHCTFCQRRTGGALSIHVWFNEQDVTLSGDDPGIYEQRSDESNYFLRLHFCKRCATTVMLTLEKRPGFRLITGGTLDNPKSIEVDCHVWRRSAQPWVCLPDNVMSYETTSAASVTTSS